LRAAAATVRNRLILSSRRWGPGAPDVLTAIRRALEGGCRNAQIHYGSADTVPAAAQEIRAELEKLGAAVSPATQSLANYAIVDDWAFLTSRDWLTSPKPGARPRLWDLGIALRGQDVVDRLLASMRELPSS
jgi:hypothetical protein